MPTSGLRIGRIFGIPIYLHPSWLLIFGLIAYSLIYMLPLSAKIPFNWRELTPISVIALDEFVLWDNVQLPYKTTKEFVDAAKKADPVFKMGGTGSKREDHILTVFMEKKTGAKFAYLPYKSGGEAATQLVGNHTASNVNNPSENLEVWRAGQVRPLCVFAKERMQYKAKIAENMSWNDIPTCKEQGLDVQLSDEPAGGGTHIAIEHDFRPRLPGFAALVDRAFTRPIASRTLATFKALAEALADAPAATILHATESGRAGRTNASHD